jgi:predicted nucleic acid-binding protein
VTFVDTNVLLDVFADDPAWKAWSFDQIGRLNGGSVSLIVLAELAPNFAAVDDLTSVLSSFGLEVVELTDRAAFIAGTRFADYRRKQPQRTRVLADFIIGAQALDRAVPLLTRDIRIYHRYFPELTLITPETHNG